MNRYPAKPIMDQMAQHGRYGDTMLVHMNPIEVAGIAALSPTGKLTTNPVTGQPEAFLPLLFGALGGALKLGTLGTAALSGIGTAAVTGDLKRGLLAGVTSGLTAGIGEAFADAGSAVDTVTSSADATASGIAGVADTAGVAEAAIPQSMPFADVGAVTDNPMMMEQLQFGTGVSPDVANSLSSTAVPTMTPISGQITEPTVSQQLFGGAEDFVNRGIGSLGTSGQLVGAMTTEGVSQQMQAQQDFEREQQRMREESEAKRRQAYDDLQGAYAMAQPGAQTGYSPYRSMMSRNTPSPFVPGMQEGGVVKMFNGGNVPDMEGFQEWLAGPGAAYANSDPAEQVAQFMVWKGQNSGGITTGTGGGTTGTGDGTTDGGAGTTPAPISTVPNEDEVRVLNIAGRGDILGREDQLVLEGYYNRLSLANQQADEADAAVTAEENTLYIPEGATNAEALQALRQANLVPTDAYNWLMRHYRETDTGDSQYFASEQFPGTEEWLASTDFNEENKNYLRQVLPLIQQGATTGIPLTGGAGSVEDIVAYNPFGGYYGAGQNTAYGGLDPVTIQKNLRGGVSVAPPRDYMPGFEPEFSYFQEDPNRLDIPSRAFRPTARRFFNYGEGYFDPVVEEQAYLDQLAEYYTKLGGYGPDSVTYPTETESTDDDPDNIGDGVTTQEPPEGGETVSRAFVNTLYQELFGRDAKDAGFAYWEDQVARGLIAPDRLKEALISSAMTHPDDHPDKIELMKYLASLEGTTTDDNKSEETDAATGPEDASNNTSSTGTSGTTDTPAQSVFDSEGYASPAKLKDTDPYLWSKRGVLTSLKADPDSREDLSPSEFQKVLEGQSGTGEYGGDLIYDPDQGIIYSGISDRMDEARQQAFMNEIERARSRQSVPFYIDPSLMTDVERVRFNRLTGGSGGKAATRIGDRYYFVNPDGSVTSYAVKDIEYGYTPRFEAGGKIPLRSSIGEAEVSAGGIANVPTEFTASMPSEQEFSMVAAAVLGRVEDPDVIVDMFVRKYGPEMFQRVREYVLQNVAPNAQTEGMIRGQGSGMDDKVPGMIGDQQPVAVSPGEFIVPADVVSGLGDGSSDAGAEELDRMMERVRMERNGTTKQAPPIDARKMMPA